MKAAAWVCAARTFPEARDKPTCYWRLDALKGQRGSGLGTLYTSQPHHDQETPGILKHLLGYWESPISLLVSVSFLHLILL